MGRLSLPFPQMRKFRLKEVRVTMLRLKLRALYLVVSLSFYRNTLTHFIMVSSAAKSYFLKVHNPYSEGGEPHQLYSVSINYMLRLPTQN